MAEPEDEDTFPNDYDGLDFDNIPGLQAPTISIPEVSVPLVVVRNIVLSAAASPVPSTESDSVDDVDSSFLAAVDALEARALNEMPRDLDPESLSRAEPGGHPTDGESALSLKLIDECLNLDDTLKTVPDSPQGGMSVPSLQAHFRPHRLYYCDFHGTHMFGIEDTRSLNQVHVYSMQSPEFSSVNRKGKRKAQPQEDIDVRAILAGYETELTCPMYVYPLRFSAYISETHYFRKLL
ncbi:hypothetical protein J3R83DRAFT_6833 [Lanmaoa asiatica]|nr:hypothetical protein J3R83DRAFT_6833 [Lanmaoa asiatica]